MFLQGFRLSASAEFREIEVRSRGASFLANDFVFLQLFCERTRIFLADVHAFANAA